MMEPLINPTAEDSFALAAIAEGLRTHNRIMERIAAALERGSREPSHIVMRRMAAALERAHPARLR